MDVRKSAPAPIGADPKPALDCSVPGALPAAAAFNPATNTSGTFHCASLTLAAGQTVDLTGDITIVADGAITIDGDIRRPVAAIGAPGVSITLISLNGDVTVGRGGSVGDFIGPAAGDAPPVAVTGPRAIARGVPGSNGGFVKIGAPHGSIEVQGRVEAQNGGLGGFADATGVRGGPWWAPQLSGGTAIAVGGQGGAGGDVILCALESIHIATDGRVEAGHAGDGGYARAYADNGMRAVAWGGPANTGGDVRLVGVGGTTQVQIDGRVDAGWCKPGGTSGAVGGDGTTWYHGPGGDGDAQGGDGGVGGTVTFTACKVIPPITGAVHASLGGDGGDAKAWGGDGKPQGKVFGPRRGGDAQSTGGDGGAPGSVPQIPLTTGGFAQGSYAVLPPGPDTGSGGTATALAGTGGSSVTRSAAKSGAATAAGGSNGYSKATATPMSTPAAGPTPAGSGTPATPTPSVSKGA